MLRGPMNNARKASHPALASTTWNERGARWGVLIPAQVRSGRGGGKIGGSIVDLVPHPRATHSKGRGCGDFFGFWNIWGFAMSDDGNVVVLEVVSRQRTIDEGSEIIGSLDVIEALEDALERARSGALFSVYISGRLCSGGTWTTWAAPSDESAHRVGLLAVLQHDLMAARG